MILWTIYVVYAVSLVLTVSPLVHIVRRRTLSRYFTYFVVTASFVVLNLLGSISPNVLGEEPSPDLHLAHFCIALALFLLYFAIDAVADRRPPEPLAIRLLDSARDTRLALACCTLLLLLAGFFGSVAFYSTISSPLLFQFDLFGSAEALIGRRVEITLSRPFHWYALSLFEIPLFLLVLLNVLRKIRGPGWEFWRLAFWLVAPISVVASMLILQKQSVLYLLASIFLVVTVFRNRFPVRALTALALAGLIAVGLQYLVVTPAAYRMLIPGVMAHRIFEAAPWSSSVAFGLFPGELPLLEGASFPNFFQLFEYEQASAAKMIYPYLYGDFAGQAPLPAMIEMYANFGWPGIGIGIILTMGWVFVVSVLSWSKNVWLFCLAIYLTIKTVFIWLVPFWFGTFEATLFVLVLFLVAMFRTVRALTRGGL